VLSAAFSPDGSHIVTASSDRTARIWDAASAPGPWTTYTLFDRVANKALWNNELALLPTKPIPRLWRRAYLERVTALLGAGGRLATATYSAPPPRRNASLLGRRLRKWTRARKLAGALFEPAGYLGSRIGFSDSARPGQPVVRMRA
jgi:hypothetical protein